MHHIFCLWRNIITLKHAGRNQDPTGMDDTLGPLGRLAVKCPMCPHSGFLYILYLAVDANFKLKRKDHKIKDIKLMLGHGQFVEEMAYKEHIQNYVDEPEVCHHGVFLGFY
jgi:hypothetical protein